MDRRTFDVAALTAELQAKLAIMEWEEKFAPKEKKNATSQQEQGQSATNNNAPTQPVYGG